MAFDLSRYSFSFRGPFHPIFFLVQGVPVSFKNFVISPVVEGFRVGQQSIKVQNGGLAVGEKGMQSVF